MDKKNASQGGNAVIKHGYYESLSAVTNLRVLSEHAIKTSDAGGTFSKFISRGDDFVLDSLARTVSCRPRYPFLHQQSA